MWYVTGSLISSPDILGRRLGIASSTAHRIFSQFLKTGDVEPKGNCGLKIYLRKFDDYMEMFIIGLILETPFYI